MRPNHHKPLSTLIFFSPSIAYGTSVKFAYATFVRGVILFSAFAIAIWSGVFRFISTPPPKIVEMYIWTGAFDFYLTTDSKHWINFSTYIRCGCCCYLFFFWFVFFFVCCNLWYDCNRINFSTMINRAILSFSKPFERASNWKSFYEREREKVVLCLYCFSVTNHLPKKRNMKRKFRRSSEYRLWMIYLFYVCSQQSTGYPFETTER